MLLWEGILLADCLIHAFFCIFQQLYLTHFEISLQNEGKTK